jgi:hypothetical protein
VRNAQSWGFHAQFTGAGRSGNCEGQGGGQEKFEKRFCFHKSDRYKFPHYERCGDSTVLRQIATGVCGSGRMSFSTDNSVCRPNANGSVEFHREGLLSSDFIFCRRRVDPQ